MELSFNMNFYKLAERMSERTVKCIVNVFYNYLRRDSQGQRIVFPEIDICLSFVVEQLKAMPRFLYFPLALLIILFNCSSLFTNLNLFVNLEENYQARKIEGWKNSSLMICRDFIYFWEGLTAFAFYSKLEK